nr:MAG TPA: tRNA-splicing ligase RtcB [Caudoviricetes sp.]
MLEKEAIDQINRMLDHEVSHGSSIRIMPDAHAGKGCTIGTTMTIKNKVVPNLVGVDIGCGMYTVALGDANIDLPKIDQIIYGIPSGFNVWEKPIKNFDLTELRCYEHLINTDRIKCSIGTLGGGNHFIEIGRASWGTNFLIIHTGSRNLGKQVAEYYQKLAVMTTKINNSSVREELILRYKEMGCHAEIEEALKEISNKKIDEDLCYLSGEFLNDYLHDMKICQEFARINRETIAEILTEKTDITNYDRFHTVHNYIDLDHMILRKGAIAAYKGQRVLIPLNMRDGSILAIGKGNQNWNYSAPHGAGRLMSRKKAREKLSIDEFRKEMSGIYSTSVNERTLDESPMAYKSTEDILMSHLDETINIVDIIKPIYNFKAEG